MEKATDYIQDAEKNYEEAYVEPISVEEFLDRVLEKPHLTYRGAEYLLNAIETLGTRTVVEKGEEKERYVFFDDPYNEGENAVVGNTDALNDFVNSLKAISSGSGKTDKIQWIEGPTASGKSEMKRCIVNGLNGFSQTEEGRVYTIEMNITGLNENSTPTSQGARYDENSWYKSPVQAHPLTIFPRKVKRKIRKNLSEKYDMEIKKIPDLPPFSREAYRELRDSLNSFEEIIDSKHVRVKNYIIDYGEGVGVLSSEDVNKNPKKKLVGSWDKYNVQSRAKQEKQTGKRDKRDFIYDGVLSQGNNFVSIIEDAMQHRDLLDPLLNVIDERRVKIDNETYMDIDTLMILTSNPDLTGAIKKNQELGQKDPLKSFKRRMDKHEFNYLVNPNLEAKLIIKEIFNLTEEELISEDYDTSKKFVTKTVGGETIEIAPRSIEAVSMYDVITRMEEPKNDLSVTDKAELMDKGTISKNGREYDVEDINVDDNYRSGIPVTYTRDIISNFIQNGSDRKYENVILPQDLLINMKENLSEAPVFSDDKIPDYENKYDDVIEWIIERQRDDVVSSIMEEHSPEESQIRNYVNNVIQWVESESNLDEDEKLRMKNFEKRYLSFTQEDYEEENIKDYRTEVSNTVSRLYYNDEDVEYREIEEISERLGINTWDEVFERYENLDLEQWEDPPTNTETDEVKGIVIDNMCELHDYTRKSAELVSDIIVKNELS